MTVDSFIIFATIFSQLLSIVLKLLSNFQTMYRCNLHEPLFIRLFDFKYCQISKTKQLKLYKESLARMDDQFDFGSYAPSMTANSRSGSMKKLTRKTDSSPQVQEKKSIKKNDDFDELDDLLNGDILSKKKDTSLNKKGATSQPKKVSDTLDSFFDEPSTNLNITSKIIQKKDLQLNKMDLVRTSINFKPQKKNQFDIIDQDSNYLPNYSKATSKQRPKSPTLNQIKIPDQSSPGLDAHTSSMRNMRPPLKKKQSQTGLGIGDKTLNINFGQSIVQDKRQAGNKFSNNLGFSLDYQTDSKPTRSMNLARKGSVDNKSDKKFDTGLTLFGQQTFNKQANISHFNIPDRNETSALRINSPKNKGKSQISEVKIGESIMINQKHSQFYASNQNTSIFKGDFQKNSYRELQLDKKDSHYSFEKPYSKLVEPPKLAASEMGSGRADQERKNLYDYKQQVEHLKGTYQKQLAYLQESLDKQMKINQQTRERLMKQANSMIEEERTRSKRIHEEQVKRVKQINEWQKNKMEESYKFQIDNLKSTISQYQSSTSTQSSSYKSGLNQQVQSQKYKRQIEHLSQQLQLQKKLLLDREHHLTKRELQLQQRHQQFNNKKRKEQEYFREHEKSMMEKQNKLRSNILNDKRQVMDEKQKIAMQAANMELDVIKRKEKVDLLIKEVQMEKNALQNERHEVRGLNQQMMARYKDKMNQLVEEKQRVANLEADLIRKLRIIELKAKESNLPLNQTFQNNAAKENNWTRERPHSTAGQKQGNLIEKQQKLNETFQRYTKVQQNANKKSSILTKMNKTIGQPSGEAFRLQDYLVSMNKHSKTRVNNFI